MGGALTALSPDFARAALGVAAMRYSLLLPRSVDFDQFAALLYPNYPDELTRPLSLSLIQMLWDRGEPNGYAHRMTTNPLPDTPPHKVLINVALGDHQVSNFTSDVEARTIGASAHAPVLDPGRWPNEDVLFGVPRITSYPFTGSAAIFYWDIGPVRPDPDNPGQTIGVPPPPLRERAQPRGRGSAQRAARRPAGREADLRLPAALRRGHGRVRRRGLPRRRLDRALTGRDRLPGQARRPARVPDRRVRGARARARPGAAAGRHLRADREQRHLRGDGRGDVLLGLLPGRRRLGPGADVGLRRGRAQARPRGSSPARACTDTCLPPRTWS